MTTIRNASVRMLLCATLVACLSFAVWPYTSQAQISHSAQGQYDKRAAEVLQKAAKRFDQPVAFTVTVKTLDSDKKQTSKQTATVSYSAGKYRVVLPDQELISDGASVWHWNKTAREVTISTLGADDIDLLNPARLLANYNKSFKAKYIRTDDDGTAVIDLQPLSSRSYHKIRLLINETSGLLKRIEVHRYDSGREIYDISGFKRATFTNALFQFDASQHRDLEIIDMR